MRLFGTLLAIFFLVLQGGDADAQRRRRKKPKGPAPEPVAASSETPEPASTVAGHIEVGPGEGEVDLVELRLADVIRSALDYSPAVQRAKIDWQSAKQDIEKQQARFDMNLTGSASHRSERSANQFKNAADDTDNQEDVTTRNTTAVQAGLQSLLSTGASYSVTASLSRVNIKGASPLFFPITPSWNNELSARITQPLMRGRGDSANQALVDREKANTELRQAQGWELRLAVALQAATSYWALVLRREELTILETNVANAITLQEIVERRVRAGQDPQSSIVQAASVVAERLQAVEAARTAIVDAERALLFDGYLADSKTVQFGQVPVPVETVDETIPSFNFEKELAEAFENRPEAQRLQQEIKVAELDQKIASNDVRPQLDVYFAGGLTGFGGTAADPTNTLVQPIDLIDGGLSQSVSNLGTFKTPFYEVGVSFAMPLGQRAAKSAYKQSELAVLRAKAQNIETQIALDVRAASQRVRIAARSLESAKESLRLAEENLEAMKLRYQGGGATLFDVTRTQDEVTRSKARIALAKAQTAVAKAGLEAAQGTLLQKMGLPTRFEENKKAPTMAPRRAKP